MRYRVALVAALAVAAVAGCGGSAEDKATKADLAAARQRIAALETRVKRLERRIQRQAPYVQAVRALCHSSRTAKGLNQDEYAVVVARALIEGIAADCDWANVPPFPG